MSSGGVRQCPPGPTGTCDFCFGRTGVGDHQSVECAVHGEGELIEAAGQARHYGEFPVIRVCDPCFTITQYPGGDEVVRCPVKLPLTDTERVAVKLERSALGLEALPE